VTANAPEYAIATLRQSHILSGGGPALISFIHTVVYGCYVVNRGQYRRRVSATTVRRNRSSSPSPSTPIVDTVARAGCGGPPALGSAIDIEKLSARGIGDAAHEEPPFVCVAMSCQCPSGAPATKAVHTPALRHRSRPTPTRRAPAHATNESRCRKCQSGCPAPGAPLATDWARASAWARTGCNCNRSMSLSTYPRRNGSRSLAQPFT
jgi:hypothetical protein